MEDKDKEPKLPMYYEQIYDLMKNLTEAYNKRCGMKYFRIFRQFYLRIRTHIPNERKEYYEQKIKDIEKDYGGFGIDLSEFRGLIADFEEVTKKNLKIIRPVYDLQLELYEDLEDSPVFKVLKTRTEELELGGE